MKELVKIASNGQWTLEKSSSAYGVQSHAPLGTEQPSSTPAPRVALYRGLNGVTAKDLKRFGVEQFNPAGGVHEHAEPKQTQLKDQGWWTDSPSGASIYSAYDHVNKKPSKEPTYDVFMVGSAEHPGGTRNITHELRAKNTPVATHRIVYLPTQGTSEEREQNIRAMLPDIKWPTR